MNGSGREREIERVIRFPFVAGRVDRNVTPLKQLQECPLEMPSSRGAFFSLNAPPRVEHLACALMSRVQRSTEFIPNAEIIFTLCDKL